MLEKPKYMLRHKKQRFIPLELENDSFVGCSVPINAPQRVFEARKCENDAPLSSFLRPWDARKNQLARDQGR